MLTKRINLASTITAVLVALFTSIGGQTVAKAQAENNSEVNKQIARIRAATAKYHDVTVAIADGYVQLGSPCIEIPGLGIDGIHYTNLPRFLQPGITLEEPEQLVYVPTRNGGLRLVSVEYDNLALYIDATGGIPGVFPSFQFPLPANLVEVAGPFSIAGQTSTGPFIDPIHGTPWFYFKHVWVWAENPNGMFADFNPRLSCTPGN
ncbi:MAG: hypothetical protein ABJC10_11780 [Acidobacteriota bacterium]